MKLTRRILNEHNIHNSYDLSQKAGSRIFIQYIPADNGRLTSRYAYWQFMRLTEKGYAYSKFTVTHREVKETVLQQAIASVKKKYGINLTDKDAFGSYHPEGTVKNLEIMFKEA